MKTIIAIASMLVLSTSLQAQENLPPYTLQELQSRFTHEHYSEKVLLEFQNALGYPEMKPELYEYIPGEIISWSIIYPKAAIHRVYRIENDSLVLIEVLPKDDAFLNKLNGYVPEKSRFTYSSDLWTFPFVKEKLDDGYYLIRASVKSYNRQPDFPNPDILLYNLEYITNDFSTFILVKLKDSDSKEWVEVGTY